MSNQIAWPVIARDDRGRSTDALELLERGRSLLGEAGNVQEEASFRLSEARALARLAEPERARELAMSAAATLTDGNPVELGNAYAVIADSFAEAGENERALVRGARWEEIRKRAWSAQLRG